MREALKKNYFWFVLILLTLGYVSFEFYYTYYAAIGVDDFWFAHWVNRYKSGLPYRDFSPYKTTLGYYILLLPFSLSHHFLTPLLYTKNALALLNACLFLSAASWLTKFFSRPAILLTTALIISAEFVLSYSTNIRVDFLAYWFCLFSALLLLDKKYILAGLILGLGFLTSQKALWYVVASNVALGSSWLFLSRDKKTFLSIVVFNIIFLAIVAIYILIWSYFSSLKVVLHNMFYEAYIMYQLDWYAAARRMFWTSIVTYNPLLFLLWPMSLLSLGSGPFGDLEYRHRFFCIIYMTVIVACLIPYKQIFPYYTLTALPAFLLGYTAFLGWAIKTLQSKQSHSLFLESKSLTWIFLFVYFGMLLWAAVYFILPSVYVLLAIVPLLFGIYFTGGPKSISPEIRKVLPKLILSTVIFIGFIYPMIIFSVFLLPERSGYYQRYNLTIARQLLKDQSQYVAGIELFYDRKQPIAGMEHLDGPAISFLYRPSPKLLPVMMESLYHSRATQSEVITNLKKSKVKFYINNYRLEALPPALKKYLASEYEHLIGSIYLYAPFVSAGLHSQTLRFNGRYILLSKESVMINGKKILPDSQVELTKGIYESRSRLPYRLRLIPEEILLNKQYREDKYWKMLG